MSGRLYVVPTPIGNLEDVTLRALRVLREVQLIAAEDTRHTRKLLNHFDIKTRCVSYHQHLKTSRIPYLLERLQSGVDIALVSDAGTPSLADPGFELVLAASEAGLTVDVLPGASAVTTAFVAAAIPAPGFLFVGFLPRRSSDLASLLGHLQTLPYAVIAFESPERIAKSIEVVRDAIGERLVAAVKEISKIHQTILRGTTSEVVDRLSDIDHRGEWCLVIAPAEPAKGEIDVAEVIGMIGARVDAGSTPRDAIRSVSECVDRPRSWVYRAWLGRASNR